MQSMVKKHNKGNLEKVLFEDHNFAGIALSINIKLILKILPMGWFFSIMLG